jgi:hypothetical protein
MTGRNLVFSLLFKTNTAAAKAAIAEIKAATAGIRGETQSSAAATDRVAQSVRRETEARRRATEAARDQARAEKEARAAAGRAVGGAAGGPGGGSGSPPRGPGPQTSPAPDLERLRAQYVPLFAAQKAYQKEARGIAAAEAAGALTRAEAAEAMSRLTRVHDRAVETIRRSDAALMGHGRTMRLQAHEASNLALQAGDTFQSLALGMSPLQVLLQQGPQVVGVLGGMRNTFRYLRQELTGFRVLMAGTTAAVLGGAYAWDQYLKSTKALEVAAARGRGLGVSAGELSEIAFAGSALGGLSVTEARGLTGQLASSGQIGAGNLTAFGEIGRDLAVTLGREFEGVGAEIIRLFAKPAEGAEELFRRGLIDAATLEEAQRLAAQNRRDAAQAAILRGLRPNLASADDARTGVGRFFERAGNFGSNVIFGVGAGIASVQRDDSLEAQLGRKRREQETFRARGLALGRETRSERLDREEADLERRIAAAAADAEAARQAQALPLAFDIAARSPANAPARRQRQLENEIAALDEARGAEGLTAEQQADIARAIEAKSSALAALDEARGAEGLTAEQQADIARAIEAKSSALAALKGRQEQALTLDQLEMQIATARNPLRRAELAGLQAFLKLAGAEVSVQERVNAGARARAAALNEAIAGASVQAASMAEEASVRSELNAMVAAGTIASADAGQWMERELALRPLIAAATKAEGKEKADLWKVIEELERAYDRLEDARRGEALAADSRASADRLADLRLEAELIGASADEAIRRKAAAEAERRIRDLGGAAVDPDAANRRRAEAAAEAEAEIALNRSRAARDRVTARELAGFDARARLAANPVERAGIEAQKEYVRVLRETRDETAAVAAAEQVRARAMGELAGAAADLLRGQDETLGRLRLEASLAGSTEAVRARAMADHEAEMQIRQMGLDLGSQEAAQIRLKARLTADQRLETERLTEAWGQVRGSAEAAIDGTVDALLKGDVEGALESLASEVTGLFAEIAIKNPLKNALLGSNLPTAADVGGLKGIWGRLSGRETEASISAMGSVGSMNVTAATVILGGAGVAGLAGGGGFGAGGAGGAWSGTLGGAADVQGQVWKYFAGKGLAPHQIAAVMGNVSAESAFNPLARGDHVNGQATSFGLFQHHAGRARGLLGAVGGEGGLGNIQGQLDYVWKELQTSESGVLKRLMAAKDVRSATEAFVGFERPQGWTAADPTGAHNWSGRLGAAEAALAKFGTTATDATGQLGTLGGGFDLFGSALANGLQGLGQGGAQGGFSGFLGTLAGGIAKGLKLPGFARGGQHRGGLRIVGEHGPELEATGPSRIYTTAQTRELLAARAPSVAANTPAPVVTLQPVLVNNTGRQMNVETEETTDARGQRQVRYVMSDMVGEGLAQPGGRAQRNLSQVYGVTRAGRRRS